MEASRLLCKECRVGGQEGGGGGGGGGCLSVVQGIKVRKIAQ